MHAPELISISIAALAAVFAAVSGVAAWRATSVMRAEAAVARSIRQYELARSFELDYRSLYPEIWAHLGPWPDPVQVDPDLRRTVHDILQTMSSVFVSEQMGLLSRAQASYLQMLYLDWLATPVAASVWASVFQTQVDTWPLGFVKFVDDGISRRRSTPTPPSDDPPPLRSTGQTDPPDAA